MKFIVVGLFISMFLSSAQADQAKCSELAPIFRQSLTANGQHCENTTPGVEIDIILTTGDVIIGGVHKGRIDANGVYTLDEEIKPEADGPNVDMRGGAANEALATCEKVANQAVSDCSAQKSDNAMASAMNTIDSATNAMNASGAAYACGQVNLATQTANAAMLTMKASCSASVGNCQKACDISPEDFSVAGPAAISQLETLKLRLTTARKICGSASIRVAGVDQNIAQLQAAQARATQCQADAASAKALANSSSSISQQCMLNPNLPVCGGSSMSSSGSSRSLPGGSATTASLPGGTGGLDGAPDGGFGTRSDGLPFGTAADLTGNTGDGKLGSNALPPGDSGGGGGKSSSGANKAEAPKKPTRDPSKINTQLFSGSFGASGANAFKAAKDAGTYNPNGSWIPPRVGPNPYNLANLNLDRFRPGALKGYRLPSTEGNHNELLGSHVDIWKQMNLRYMSLTRSLMP